MQLAGATGGLTSQARVSIILLTMLRWLVLACALISITWSCDRHPGGASPSGMIALFEGVCPAGWSRYSPLDGRFPRGSSMGGTSGGGEDHSHVFDITARTSQDGTHAHVLAGGEPIDVDKGFYGNIGIFNGYLQAFEEAGRDLIKASRARALTEEAAKHDHLISVSGDSSAAAVLPPYLDLVFCRKE